MHYLRKVKIFLQDSGCIKSFHSFWFAWFIDARTISKIIKSKCQVKTCVDFKILLKKVWKSEYFIASNNKTSFRTNTKKRKALVCELQHNVLENVLFVIIVIGSYCEIFYCRSTNTIKTINQFRWETQCLYLVEIVQLIMQSVVRRWWITLHLRE